MNQLRVLAAAFLTIQILEFITPVSSCSSVCTCTTIPAKTEDGESGDVGTADEDEEDTDLDMAQPRGRKVVCSNNPYPISSIEDISRVTTIPLDTIKLDLSKNTVAVIRKGSFFNRLSDLQRLDLSNNHISLIEPGAFEGLHNLKRLDLSHNKLGSINGSIFTGLQSLQKLMLSFNKLNTIPEGTFNDLPALRRIEFQSDYLRCDCHLQWIVKWSKDKKVKISPSTVCAVPKELKGISLKKLKFKDLHCNRPLELPLFEIIPGKSQIVFEGDKLPLECRAQVIDPQTKMYWLRQGEVVETNRSAGVFVLTRKSPDHTVMLHSLVLDDLKVTNRGEWLCMVSTPQGNVTKPVNIVVIDRDANQCKEVTTKTNKGVYVWKATVSGVIKSVKCKIGNGVVTYECDESGRWVNLNHSSCDYTNEFNRKLKTLAEKDSNSTKLLNDAKNLEKLVSAPFKNNDSTLINSEYVDLASLAIFRLSSQAHMGEDIANSVLHSASKIMNISASILMDAQRQRKSCTRIVKSIEGIPWQMKDRKQYPQSSDLIIMEARTFSRRFFPGVQCSRLELELDQHLNRMVQATSRYVFVCTQPVQNSTELSYLNLAPATSILVPKSALWVPDSNSTNSTEKLTDKISFQFIWYQNANFFQPVTKQHDDPVLQGKEWKVVSSIISAAFSEPLVNLTEPVELVFEIQETDKNLVAAYWDFSADGGFGDWRTDGCKIIDLGPTLVTVHSYHLTAFAILEDQSSVRISMFQMMEIVVYIGSCICLLSLMAVIITYVSCFRFLNVPKKMKHSVINICVSILLLIITFTMGVKRTDQVLACQIVGIILHYLTLVTMFWITVTASNMLKKFLKAEKPPPPPIDLPMPLPPKPMLRFYLLAWGVPSIICGITAAVSFEFYDMPNHCFLEWEPSLGAFIGPVGFLVLLNFFFFLRISCIIRGSKGLLHTLEETQELHVTDIELTMPEDSRIETQSLHSQTSTKSSASSLMDFERRPITQLRALVAILFLFIVTWFCGAVVAAKPFSSVIPYEEIIFSYLYGILCAIFGLFMLIYYCLTRKDSRTSWKRFFLCEQQTVYDVGRSVPTQMPHANGHVSTESGTDISLSNKVTKVAVANHIKKTPDDISSVSLVDSKPPSLIDDTVLITSMQENVSNFYNPRQNGVAKKFWEKKNKHNSKLLSREMTTSLNMNESGTESNFSGSERPCNGQGYLSDSTHGNLNLNHTKSDIVSDMQGGRSPTQLITPPSYSAVVANKIAYSKIQPNRNMASPVGNTSPTANLVGNSGVNNVSYTSAQVVPHHTRSSSSSSLGMHNHNSAFSIVPPRNNTLPRQGKVASPQNSERNLSEMESVQRLGDFDGQSQVSSSFSHEQQRSQQPSDMYLSGYSSPPDGYSNEGSVYKQYGPIDVPNGSAFGNAPYSPNSARNRTNSGGYSSDNSNRNKRKLENSFVKEIEQRVPQGTNTSNVISDHVTGKPPMSPVSDSDNNNRFVAPDSDSQIHYKKHRFNDSDHNSEPASQTHHKHGKLRNSHKHSKYRGLQKQRSLDWEDQFQNKPHNSVIPYAFVNHNYKDRVIQKLTAKAMSENIDPKSRAFWIPRSSSGYDEMVEEENKRLCEDSTSSSSDDDDSSLDNVWVMQKERKHKKDKKETSV